MSDVAHSTVIVKAKDVVPGTEPVEDGKALGVAIAKVLEGRATDVTVDLDGLRLGTVSSSFIGMAVETIKQRIPGVRVADQLHWTSSDEEFVEIAEFCTRELA